MEASRPIDGIPSGHSITSTTFLGTSSQRLPLDSKGHRGHKKQAHLWVGSGSSPRQKSRRDLPQLLFLFNNAKAKHYAVIVERKTPSFHICPHLFGLPQLFPTGNHVHSFASQVPYGNINKNKCISFSS